MTPQDRNQLVEYRKLKARETLNEVDLHIQNELWNTAVNRLYYACYYAVMALLIDIDVKPQTHSGVRQMFGLYFIKTGIIDANIGKFFSDIYDKRQTSDYDDFIIFEREDVIDLIEPAKTLILFTEKYLKKE